MLKNFKTGDGHFKLCYRNVVKLAGNPIAQQIIIKNFNNVQQAPNILGTDI